MRVGATLRKWLHRERYPEPSQQARRWHEEHAGQGLTKAEINAIVRRSKTDPMMLKAFTEAEELRKQGSETRNPSGLSNPSHSDR